MTSPILAELSARLRQLERSRVRLVPDISEPFSTATDLHRLLPNISSFRGGLVEWLSDMKGAGRLSLAVLASQSAVGNDYWIFVDDRSQLHLAGLASLSLDLQRLVLVRPQRSADALWVVEQALRTRGVGAVVCEFDRLSTTSFRRLQLAAETGGTLGILLRPERAQHQPSWAEYRILVRPLATSGSSDPWQPRRRLQVELLRARKELMAAAKLIFVELQDADGRVCLVSGLAAAAPAARATPA
jgi:protein ImuA